MTENSLPPLAILVVEDLPDAAESTAQLLTMHGHRVRVAGSGPAALKLAAVETPDVVLLDIGLPGMNGWEVARRLREQTTAKQPVVVAVTGYGHYEHRLQSADAGVDQHLVKPVDPAALTGLLARLRCVVSLHRGADAAWDSATNRGQG